MAKKQQQKPSDMKRIKMRYCVSFIKSFTIITLYIYFNLLRVQRTGLKWHSVDFINIFFSQSSVCRMANIMAPCPALHSTSAGMTTASGRSSSTPPTPSTTNQTTPSSSKLQPSTEHSGRYGVQVLTWYHRQTSASLQQALFVNVSGGEGDSLYRRF